ncbi:MAG: hypothetical protein Q8754_02820 [Sweet potato little leaf phytoplasma]|nr:hypothetical protein [Sweet potato little leaf phytoplasma]
MSSSDEVIWHLDSRGIFSVKNAYRLGMQLQDAPEASVSNVQQRESLWKKFWKTDTDQNSDMWLEIIKWYPSYHS